jgi:hypothetical protein
MRWGFRGPAQRKQIYKEKLGVHTDCVCSLDTFYYDAISAIRMQHRVGRVLSFFSSRRNCDSPNPSPAGECAPPPPPVLGGGDHSLRGWESPNSDEGTYTVVLFIYTVRSA